MTNTQFKAAIAKLNLSQEAAGLAFGASKRQGQRWASGDVPVPWLVAKVIGLVLRGKISLRDLE